MKKKKIIQNITFGLSVKIALSDILNSSFERNITKNRLERIE